MSEKDTTEEISQANESANVSVLNVEDSSQGKETDNENVILQSEEISTAPSEIPEDVQITDKEESQISESENVTSEHLEGFEKEVAESEERVLEGEGQTGEDGENIIKDGEQILESEGEIEENEKSERVEEQVESDEKHPEIEEVSSGTQQEESKGDLDEEKKTDATEKIDVTSEEEAYLPELERSTSTINLEKKGISLSTEMIDELAFPQPELPEIRGLTELEEETSQEKIAEDEVEYEDEDDEDDDEIPDQIDSYMRRLSRRLSIAAKMMQSSEAKGNQDETKSKKDAKTLKKTLVIEEEVKEKLDILDRELCYEMYPKLSSELTFLRVKNKFLQRKMAEHFKKRKIMHVLKEESNLPVEAIQKYEKRLDQLQDLVELHESECKKIESELNDLQKERDNKYNELQKLFHHVVNREKEIGIGLINTKTGKEIPEEVVERLIKRQVNARKQISELRLKYILRRDELTEKNAELKSLDNIGDDLTLADFEQLKIENRAYADKLEEKEEELTKLRQKCRNAVQIMAHIREKSAALDADIDVLRGEYDEIRSDYIDIRERLNECKTARDVIRNKTSKLKADSGLLTKPKLLIDLESSMNEAEILEKTLENIREDYTSKTHKIRNLRKNILIETLTNKNKPKDKKKVNFRKYYPVRPSLVAPILPHDLIQKLNKMIDDD